MPSFGAISETISTFLTLTSLGQKPKAGSLPVAIASDQDPLAVTAGSLPLPAGASTAAKQPALGTAGSASADVISVQGVAGGVAQPMSAASLPLPAGAATESTLGTLAQEGAPITGQSLEAGGTHVLGWLASLRKAITDRLPSALTGSGNLKVALVESTATQAISVATLPLPTGAAADATLTGGTAKAIPRGGAKGVTSAADLTGTAEGADHQALDVQLYHGGTAKDPTAIRALTSADVVSLGAGSAVVGHVINDASSAVIGHVIADTGSTTAVTGNVATTNAAASQADGHSSTFGATTDAAVTTDVTGSISARLRGLVNLIAARLPAALGAGGGLKVDGSGTALPVSGTVTGNQGTAAAGSGAWPIKVTDTSDALVRPGDATNNAVRVNIVAGAGSGGTAQADKSAFTEGTTSATPISGVFNETIAADPTEDQAAAVRITAKRALHVHLRDGQGDSAMDDANNALRVNVVAGGGAGGTSSGLGSADPATGTAAGYSDGTNMREARVFDADSGAGTQFVLGALLKKPASGGSVDFGTSTDPVRTDPTGTTTQPVSGTVTANAGTNLNTSALALDATLGTTNTEIGGLTETAPATDTASSGLNGRLQRVAQRLTTLIAQLPAALGAGGGLKVDGSGTALPVSQSGAPWGVNPTAETAGVGVGAAADAEATVNGSAIAVLKRLRTLLGALTDGTQKSRLTDGTTEAAVQNIGAGQHALTVGGGFKEVAFTTTSVQPVGSTDVTQYRWIGVQITSQGTGATVAFQGSNDNFTTVFSVGLQSANSTGAAGAQTATTATGLFYGPLGYRYFRINVTGISAGTTAGLIELFTTPGALIPANITVQPGNTANTTAWKVDGSAVTQPVSGAVTANVGTTNGLALDATLTGGTAKAIARGGQKGATTTNADITHTAEGADHEALDVQIMHGGAAKDPTQVRALTSADVVTTAQGTAAAGSGAWPVKVTDTSDALVRPGDAANNAIRVNVVAGGASGGTSSSFGSADPATGTAAGYSDGTNLREARVFDADSGAGTQFVLGALLKKPASGGSVDFGTNTDPVRTDPTGTTTQPVSGTFFQATQPVSAASLPLPTGAALDATVGTTNTEIGGLTETAPATDTASSGLNGRLQRVAQRLTTMIAQLPASLGQKAMAASLPVVIASDQGAVPVSAASLPLPTGAATSAKQPALGTAGSASADVISVQGVASMTALKVDGSAVTQPVSAASLPLPTGAAADATLTGGTAKARITDGTNTAAVKAASTAAAATDPALVVALSPNSPIPTGSNVIGALSANQSTNVAQVGGATVSTAASGVQKVGVVGNAGATVDSPVGAGTAPTNAVAAAALFNPVAPAPTAGQAMALQADQAGNLRTMSGVALAALAAWNSGTALNATQTIFTNSGADSVLVHLVQTTTLTAGAITFELSYDGNTWVPIPAQCVLDPASTSFAQLAVPYTVQASTNKPFLIALNGAQALRIKLSTQITGTGSVTPNYALLNYGVVDTVIALSPTAANFNVNSNLQTGTNTVGNVGAVTIASGGASTYEAVAAGSNNAASIKGSAGKVLGWYIFNAAAATRYVKLYDKATAPAPATDTVKWVIAVPAGGAANMAFGEGLDFPTGIGIAMVTGISNTDNSSVTANDLVVSIAYK